jgi:tetratricopeptide (TPR) repeat protein
MKSSLKSLANFRRIVGAGLAAAALGLAATSAAQAANPWTASRLYNQANADARGGKYGAAILGYRRAELLAPRDPDIATNLAWVRARAGLPARAEPWFRRADRALSLAGWTGLWLGTLWLLCAALTLVATAQRGRRLWLGCAVAAAVAALGSGAGFALANVELRTAVVTARQGTDLRLSPFADAASEGRLGEGASLRTDAQHGTYLHVRGGDGRQGWIDSVAVEPLVPGTS